MDVFTFILTNFMECRTLWVADICRGNKFPIFYGTRKFISMIWSFCDCFLPWARWIHFTPLHPVFCCTGFVLFSRIWKYISALRMNHHGSSLLETCNEVSVLCTWNLKNFSSLSHSSQLNLFDCILHRHCHSHCHIIKSIVDFTCVEIF
jgi:hypothetical protein